MDPARGIADFPDDLAALLLAGDLALLQGNARLADVGLSLAAVDQRQGYLQVDSPPIALKIVADIADFVAVPPHADIGAEGRVNAVAAAGIFYAPTR